jgi:hypothetical protein
MPQTIEALYAVADRQGWMVDETLERALVALQRELARGRVIDTLAAERARPSWRRLAG